MNFKTHYCESFFICPHKRTIKSIVLQYTSFRGDFMYISRIINMTTVKGTTYFALLIRYPDGSCECLYDLRPKDVKEKTFGKSEGFKAYLVKP